MFLQREEDYPEVVKETDKYVDYVNPWFDKRYSRSRTTREKKFLCIGGPFDGCYYTRTQLRFAAPHYSEFNNAGGSRHKVIFAWNTEER